MEDRITEIKQVPTYFNTALQPLYSIQAYRKLYTTENCEQKHEI